MEISGLSYWPTFHVSTAVWLNSCNFMSITKALLVSTSVKTQRGIVPFGGRSSWNAAPNTQVCGTVGCSENAGT